LTKQKQCDISKGEVPVLLAELPVDEKSKVICVDILAVEPAELDERNVTFKQVPYNVKVY
jgi:hypothetical protein